MTLKECYQILKVEQSASLEDIKRAYRRRAFELHPDLNPHVKDASRQFQLLNEAYVVLTRLATARENASREGAARAAQQETRTAGPRWYEWGFSFGGKKAEDTEERRAERDEAYREQTQRDEQEREEKNRAERERLEKEKQEKAQQDKERAEHERLEHERLERERLEGERLERERLERERLERERLELERLERERRQNPPPRPGKAASASTDTQQRPRQESGPAPERPKRPTAASPDVSSRPEAEAPRPDTGTPRPEAAGARPGSADNLYAEQQEVLRDILNDDFARRVFEDIYSEIRKKSPPPTREQTQQARPQARAQTPPHAAQAQKNPSAKPWDGFSLGLDQFKLDFSGGVGNTVKNWLRGQIDEEQTIRLPASGLFPGARVRLQIRRGLSGELTTLEVTLPPDFAVGKPIRLKGMGKKLGSVQGDFYLTVVTK